MCVYVRVCVCVHVCPTRSLSLQPGGAAASWPDPHPGTAASAELLPQSTHQHSPAGAVEPASLSAGPTHTHTHASYTNTHIHTQTHTHTHICV